MCPINQFIPNKFNDSIKKQISCTRMVKSVASGPHQTIRACNNHYTNAEAPCMHKIHVGSAIWLQVTLLLFKVVAKAKYKISYEIHSYESTGYSNCFSLDWYMFSINLSFTMEGENILCMNNYEHWKLETCTCIKMKTGSIHHVWGHKSSRYTLY